MADLERLLKEQEMEDQKVWFFWRELYSSFVLANQLNYIWNGNLSWKLACGSHLDMKWGHPCLLNALRVGEPGLIVIAHRCRNCIRQLWGKVTQAAFWKRKMVCVLGGWGCTHHSPEITPERISVVTGYTLWIQDKFIYVRINHVSINWKEQWQQILMYEFMNKVTLSLRAAAVCGQQWPQPDFLPEHLYLHPWGVGSGGPQLLGVLVRECSGGKVLRASLGLYLLTDHAGGKGSSDCCVWACTNLGTTSFVANTTCKRAFPVQLIHYQSHWRKMLIMVLNFVIFILPDTCIICLRFCSLYLGDSPRAALRIHTFSWWICRDSHCLTLHVL